MAMCGVATVRDPHIVGHLSKIIGGDKSRYRATILHFILPGLTSHFVRNVITALNSILDNGEFTLVFSPELSVHGIKFLNLLFVNILIAFEKCQFT